MKLKEVQKRVFGLLLFTFMLVFTWGSAQTSITAVLPADIRSLDKAVDETFNATNITLNVFDRLVQYDSELNLKPMLATSWETIDSNTWRFHLRDDVTFHNGEAFNAESVQYTLERAARPESALGYYVTNVDHVEVVDKYTVDIVTLKPDPILPRRIGAWIDMAPPLAAESSDFGENPIGTGPFTFVEWTKGNKVVLEANKEYWGGAPAIDRVEFRFVPEASTRVSMLLSGEADIIPDVAPELISRIEGSARTRVTSVLGLRKMVVIIDPSVEPLGDPRVRQALNFAVNKQLIIDAILGGNATQATGMIHSILPTYQDELTDYYAYDPEKAKDLLADAGYPDGFTVSLFHPVGTFVKDAEISQAIAGQLSEVGVEVELQPREWGAFYTSLSEGNLGGLGYMRYGNAKVDASELYTWALWSEGSSPYVTDPQMDELIVKTESEMDADEREQLFAEMERITVQELVPWIFLFDLHNVYGVSEDLTWEPIPYEPIDLREASFE